MAPKPPSADAREILFEMTAIGNTVKVTAIDTVTGIEAAIIGPATAGQHALKIAAMRKLKYVIEKKQGGE